jgi:uncharacterized protein (TIGR03067 family)
LRLNHERRINRNSRLLPNSAPLYWDAEKCLLHLTEKPMTDTENDLDRLQGTWAVTTLVVDGNAIPSHVFATMRLIVEGDRFTTLGMETAYAGTLKVDSSANPRTLDMLFDEGPEKGNTNRGIYEFTPGESEDDDTWRLCLATRGDGRPKTFASPPGTGIALETLERDHNSTE